MKTCLLSLVSGLRDISFDLSRQKNCVKKNGETNGFLKHTGTLVSLIQAKSVRQLEDADSTFCILFHEVQRFRSCGRWWMEQGQTVLNRLPLQVDWVGTHFLFQASSTPAAGWSCQSLKKKGACSCPITNMMTLWAPMCSPFSV